MQTVLIIALSLHVLSSVFWAGSSFTLARTGGLGGEKLLFPQIGAATVAIVTGATLWRLVHEGSFGLSEQILSGWRDRGAGRDCRAGHRRRRRSPAAAQ
ncbi:hypothetical protein [Bradyrhizobium sp. BR 1433]|uniref:hypothetical protein n=1 Tax=Bradyrhizobium sp. BR 1433 TaxID=3447967 RepID=UPI003EE4A5F4